MKSIFMASRQLGRLAINHAPTTLTFSAIAGVGATALLTGRAAIKAKDISLEMHYTYDHEPTKKEIAKKTIPQFIPPVVMGAVTIACILGAHKLHLRNQAALAAAYTMVETKYRDYQNEVVREIGEKKESRIQDTIAQNKVNNDLKSENGLNVIRTRNGDILFMDSFSGRYFYSSYEAVDRAKIRVTQIAQSELCVSLNDFYQALEIPTTEGGAVLGWNICDVADQTFEDTIPVLTNRVCKTPTPEELPCVVIDYMIEPLIDFNKCI